MGARRRCCCPEGCWFFIDDFGDGTTRNNTTDLGSHWNEVEGEWGISGWALIENWTTGGGTANALLICTEPCPEDSAGAVYQGVDIYVGEGGAVAGEVFYLYPTCPDTETTAFEVTFECLEPPGSWRVTCGSETKDFTIHPDEYGWVQAWCCIDGDGGQAKAWMNYGINEPVWNDDVDAGTGRYSGVGHDNEVASPNLGAVLDDYFIGELRTETNYECFGCLCVCDDYPLQKELTATFTYATSRAVCLEGESFTLTWEWNAGSEQWVGQKVITGPNGVPWTLKFYLECGSGSWDTFVLRHDPANACCTSNQKLCDGSNPTDASTCEPLSLVFGPFLLRGDDLACWLCYNPNEPNPPGCIAPTPMPPGWEPDLLCFGSYYIVVTDA